MKTIQHQKTIKIDGTTHKMLKRIKNWMGYKTLSVTIEMAIGNFAYEYNIPEVEEYHAKMKER